MATVLKTVGLDPLAGGEINFLGCDQRCFFKSNRAEEDTVGNGAACLFPAAISGSKLCVCVWGWDVHFFEL